MNIIEGLQDLMAQVPDLLQPLIVALAGAIPFVEGELASVLGVWAGLNPFLAFGAAVAGNVLSVFVVVFFGARIRAAIVARRARNRQRDLVAAGFPAGSAQGAVDSAVDETPAEPESKGRRRFRTFLVRFGVPGASLLGPLALPTQFTSAMLVASGVPKGWIMLWQTIAIALWAAVTTAIATGVLSLVLA